MTPIYNWLQIDCSTDDVAMSGWAVLYLDLLAEIDRALRGSTVKVRLLQVKEKHGSLRVYYRLDGQLTPSATNRIADALTKAWRESCQTCFECGEPGSMRNAKGWIVPLCDYHAVTVSEMR